ncbi:MAG TPA: hypothetical protein VFU22_01980 [Roseiflexaceae bacterium]|nr:hypothetical protein [Roseiflexaceae bacterium]
MLHDTQHCQFGPDGALYVVDWGEIHIAPERGGPRGERPPEPMKVPVYALQLASIVGAAGLADWAIWRLLRGRRQ